MVSISWSTATSGIHSMSVSELHYLCHERLMFMFKKALIILTLSSVVSVPSLAAAAHGAALPLQEKAPASAKAIIKNAAFGQEVWVMLGSPIPTGWVVIRSSGNMNLIKDMNNAPSGYEVWVMLGSPIPDGWVVIRSSGSMNQIKNLNSASSNQEVWVMLGSPIPDGWVVIRSSGSMNQIKNLNNAPSGQEVWVMLGSPIPDGWIVVRSSGTMNLIKRL
ncbi:hypothetical protein P4V62_10040 [Brevibacillus formosus]|nr:MULTISPECIES: hypothetical protein [Brevibacillus]MED1945255.1 hypothetical protein [Brevibacillus formosus]MED1998622.1 hypothetical protein [Brevibacillus formosus]MED2083591.1 hypothetical protein [Brevibacillus formosus]